MDILGMNPTWCNRLAPFGACGSCDVCTRRVAEWDPRLIRDTIRVYLDIRPHLPLWRGALWRDGAECKTCVLC